MPVNFYNKQDRMFALALPANASDTSNCTWSPPVTVVYPGTPELHLNIPVTDEWVSNNLVAPGATRQAPPAAAPAGADASSTGSIQLSRCSKSLLTSKQQVAGSGDGLELQAKTVAVLRMSMQVHSPGCIHVVLHNAGCQPPFLLQNRTRHALVFRQESTQDTWRLLEPHSAVGFSWPYAKGV